MKKICPSCGHDTSEHDAGCPVCGKELTPSERPADALKGFVTFLAQTAVIFALWYHTR
jgi:hypothetical protein